MRTIEDIVRAEVHYCVSSLVHTLAQGMGGGVNRLSEAGRSVSDLTEQAFELACPIDDWEEAAAQEGWRVNEESEFTDGEETLSCIAPTDPDGGWRTLCEAMGYEPYQRDVYEHWIVSDWLADRLAEKGEKVDKDFAGLTVWARTTTGQGIAMDSVIEAIHADLVREYGE